MREGNLDKLGFHLSTTLFNIHIDLGLILRACMVVVEYPSYKLLA
jgi:hypothetical protein